MWIRHSPMLFNPSAIPTPTPTGFHCSAFPPMKSKSKINCFWSNVLWTLQGSVTSMGSLHELVTRYKIRHADLQTKAATLTSPA